MERNNGDDMTDFNRDGKEDKRDYYENLGGAHYFRPPGLYDDGRHDGRAEKIFVVIARIIFVVFGIFILLKMGGC